MEIKRIDPQKAKELLESGNYTYIDVRTPPEYEAGHVPGAKNIPVVEPDPMGRMQANPQFVDVVEKNFGKGARLIVGCQKGGRSLKAAQILQQAGFADILDMRGGFGGETDPMGQVTFPGWKPRGLPLCQNCSPEDSYDALARK